MSFGSLIGNRIKEFREKMNGLNKKISSIDLEEQKKLLRMFEYLSNK